MNHDSPVTLFTSAKEAKEAGYSVNPAATEHRECNALSTNEAAQGHWIGLHWNRQAFWYPNKSELGRCLTSRNRGLINEHEQSLIASTRVAIIGLSVGSASAESLMRIGVTNFLVADGDTIAPSNLNRLVGSTWADVGLSKATWIERRLLALNPYSDVVSLPRRVESSDMQVGGQLSDYRPTIVVDAVDDLIVKIQIRRFCKEARIPLVMASDVGWRSIVDVEDYRDPKTQLFNGRAPTEMCDLILTTPTAELIAQATVQIVGAENASERMFESFVAAQQGNLAGIPQLGPTASVGGAAVAAALVQLVTGAKPSERHMIELAPQ